MPKNLIRRGLTPITVLIYFVLLVIGNKTGLRLEGVAGILLLLYLPGRSLIRLNKNLGLGLGPIGRVGLSAIFSFVITSVIASMSQPLYGFSSPIQIYLLIVVALIFFIVEELTRFIKKLPKYEDEYVVNRLDIVILSVLALTILTSIIMSPLAQNADNYLIILKQSIAANANLLNIRPSFNAFLGISYKMLSINLNFLFRNIFLILFYCSTLVFYDFLRRNLKDQRLAALGYLSLLISPVVLSEINIIRAQVVLLFMTLPIITLSIDSIKKKNIFISLVAIFIAVISYKMHELSSLLILTALIAILVNVARLIFVERKIKFKHIVLFIIILFPYFKIFNVVSALAPAGQIITYAHSFINRPIWRWWFLNNYQTIDGATLSWSGIGALYYYLYNGLLFLLLIFAVYTISKLLRKKTPLAFLPLIYIAIFFIFAEILPRIGLFFIPNRAWIHLILASVVFFALLLKSIENEKKILKILFPVTISLIVVGFSGAIYIARNNVDQVFKEEMAGAKYINSNIAKNAVVLSSQDNLTLIELYANRSYGRILTDQDLDQNKFKMLFEDKLQALSSPQITTIRPELVETSETLIQGKVINRNSHVSQQEFSIISGPDYSPGAPVYFYYSFRKNSGINGQREYKKSIVDSLNTNKYKTFGYETTYEDPYCILLKIKN